MPCGWPVAKPTAGGGNARAGRAATKSAERGGMWEPGLEPIGVQASGGTRGRPGPSGGFRRSVGRLPLLESAPELHPHHEEEPHRHNRRPGWHGPAREPGPDG